MGVINDIGFRRFASFTDALAARLEFKKKSATKVFCFYCCQHILAHISGHGCEKLIRFSVVCIIYGCAYSQIKIRKSATKRFPVYCWQHISAHISGHGSDK